MISRARCSADRGAARVHNESAARRRFASCSAAHAWTNYRGSPKNGASAWFVGQVKTLGGSSEPVVEPSSSASMACGGREPLLRYFSCRLFALLESAARPRFGTPRSRELSRPTRGQEGARADGPTLEGLSRLRDDADMKVVAVGARGRWIPRRRYQEQLERWSREARASGRWEEVMTEEQIEAEVTRTAGIVSVSINEFALLDSGEYVVTDDDRQGHFGIHVTGTVAAASPDGPGLTRAWDELRLPASGLESEIREAVLCLETSPEERWARLVAALRENGIVATAQELDSLPFSVELIPESDV